MYRLVYRRVYTLPPAVTLPQSRYKPAPSAKLDEGVGAIPDKVYRERLSKQRESRSMAPITHLKTTPHTRIENSIIANMAEIGVYCYAVYSAIKMHLNQATGACFPSYATIARMTGIHRSTVIECVKKLTALKLISPQWRYKEDGSHASNQYDFQAPEPSVPAKKSETIVQKEQCSRPEPPPLVAQDDHPSRPEPPEQVFRSNKKQRTIAEVDFYPTEKQKTCPHPAPTIVYLADNITILPPLLRTFGRKSHTDTSGKILCGAERGRTSSLAGV
jgi:hypothetical protein